MSWVPHQQVGVWDHKQIVDGKVYIMFPRTGIYLRNVRIATNGGKKIAFTAWLQQSSIRYWEKQKSIKHAWRTPFLVHYAPESMNVCHLVVQVEPDTLNKGEYSQYIIEWEESRERPHNAFIIGWSNYDSPEPASARL